MRSGDALSGAIIATVGAAVLATAATFPAMPGQNVGPALFPGLIGAGVLVSGLILLLGGRFGRPADAIRVDDGLGRPRMAFNAVFVVASLLIYALVVGTIGFFVTSSALLVGLFLAFGVKARRAIPIAIVVPVILHYMFYTVLRVPLPWGVLEGIAW